MYSFCQKMLRWFASFIFRDNLVTYNESDYKKVLFPGTTKEADEEEELKPNESVESKCEHRIGKITRLEPNYGLIDDQYYFEIADVKQKNVKVGQSVRYLAYRISENVEWKIKQISVTQSEEWASERCEVPVSKVTGEYMALKKTLTARIINRRGRVLTMEPNNITCDLDRVRSEFLPVEGDWLSLTAVVELRDDTKLEENIIEIELIKPLRSRIYEGKVSHLSEIGTGIIGSQIFFTNNVCEGGFMPGINDKVVARVIESDQGALLWRAIHVIIMESSSRNNTLLHRIGEERLFDSKHGVLVTAKCDKTALKIGEQTTFKIIVENSGGQSQTLQSAFLKNSEHNNVMKLVTDIFEPVVIPGASSHVLEVVATASSSGHYSEIIVLHFEGDWKIGYLLDIYVHIEEEYRKRLKNGDVLPQNGVDNNYDFNNYNDQKTKTKFQKDSYQAKRQAAKLKTMPTKTGFVVPGVRPVKPTAFLPKILPEFPIPESIRNIVTGDGVTFKNNSAIATELENAFPYLVELLKPSNYLNKYHTLLHLEDLEVSFGIKKFDRDRVSFIKKGEYLVLQIEHLAESRPSLVVGDKLIACEPTMKGNRDAVSYEGYIHKVTSDSIKLKFCEAFHNQYDGKSMNVTFIHSRSAIRRAHQALNEAFRILGQSWLFPNTFSTLKSDQVNVIGEYPATNVSDIEHVCKTVETQALPVEKSVLAVSNSGPKSKSRNSRKSLTNGWRNVANMLDFHSDSEVSDSEEPSKIEARPSQHSYVNVRRPANAGKPIEWEEESRRDRNKTNHMDKPSKVVKANNIQRRDVIVKWVNPMLNKYQRTAVKHILKGEARPSPYIIHGPPGTGKTITVVETILQIIFLIPESRILVATPSNSSADLLCERLLSWNLLKPGDLVRLVGYNYMIENRMSPFLKPYCTCIDTKSTDKNVSQINYDEDGVKYSSREVVGRHRITVGTCVSVGALYMMGFPKNHFTHVIIDEAGQSTEPEIMIPLSFLNGVDGQAILAGDPRQLGPVVTSRLAANMGLGDSLLSRFYSSFLYHCDPQGFPETNGYNPRVVTRLLYNYRSLPNIMELYNDLFYNSELIPKVCPKCSPEVELVERVKHNLRESAWHNPGQVIFHGVKGIDMQEEDSPSWYNDHEITRVIRYVSALYTQGLQNTDIGVVTPYQKQVYKLREMMRGCELDLPKVGTVEEFQGQERNVIIISTVRSSDRLVERDLRHALGFVSSQQRLNVAISRARALLIIIGNPHLLGQDQMWKKLIKMCKKRGYYVGCDLPSWLIE